MEQAKRPVTVLAGPYGHPLHPALVALPIGAWIASLVFDIGSYVVDDPGFLVAGSRWLIGLGVLGAVAAASVGLLDFFALTRGTRAYRVALLHMTLNLAATIGYAIGFVIRGGQAATDQAGTADPVGFGPLALSVVCLAVLSAGGFLGGELAYRHGVRVADERTQAAGHQVSSSAVTTGKDTS
jgi:uncharacterized membrane protein